MRIFLGFDAVTLYEGNNLSPNPADISSFDNNFLECDTVKRNIFRRKRKVITDIFTTDVDPGYKNIEKFRGGVQKYKMGSKDFLSSISFKLKHEKNQLVSFNGKSKTFRMPIKKIYLITINDKDKNEISIIS